MFRSFTTTAGASLLLFAALATTVAAADDAEFAFNLLSDIAPILALFGDQFAKQFTSESLTWVDHLIFAMVPLGIITAITGAIRVQGNQVAKAFIGRARENRALAEIELMSSTSGEVCELFNGSSIVRSLGKPKIGQFIIFPNEYDDLEKKYKPFDDALASVELGYEGKESKERGKKTKHAEQMDEEQMGKDSNDEEPKDESCGIHSLRTATLREPGESKLMNCEPYSSHSAKIVQKRLKSALAISSDLWQHPLSTLMNIFRSAPPTTPEDEEIAKPCDSAEVASTKSSHSPLPPEAEPALRGPPNLQLNLSSDHFDDHNLKKRHEIVLAGFAAVLLQTSLIVVAAATAYYINPASSSLLESKVYGFPCYAAGSVLLSIGTGLCSSIVEHSTIEHSWNAVNSTKGKADKKKAKLGKDAPRLVWIQQSQTVNDQSFRSYAILAGPKRRVITSRRDDDIRKHRSGDKSTSGGSQSSEDKNNKVFWEWLTVGAALSAGLGFTAQFMGLRGLAFPCSIAQLGAIFIMALIRAGIRRRLGRVPAHCPALDGYELDFLAAQIVFHPDVRNFHRLRRGEENYGGDTSPIDFCRWKVRTLDNKRHDRFFAQSSPINQEDPGCGAPELNKQHSTSDSEHYRSDPTPKEIRTSSAFQASSSQQLLRVRERLGDLCNFKSKSSDSAVSLAQSIELFMDTFFPPTPSQKLEYKGKDLLSSLNWLIESTRLTASGVSADLDRIKIPVVRRKSDGKWEVDIGKVDAALSLWMASIEAKKSKDAKDAQERKDSQQGLAKSSTVTDLAQHSGDSLPDWRRTKAGDDLRYSFGRIIGDNLEDEVLKRDISWWVDSLVAEQSDSTQSDSTMMSGDSSNSHGSSPDENGRRWSRARSDAVELVIGFNGNKPHNANARELGITSKACLDTILAQHLFTSFMWTVVEFLPRNCLSPGTDEIQQEVEIEGPTTFESYDFDQTWFRPRLRHRQLTKVVRKMESYGLGSTTDILLCMIPALSSNSLLPNQAILKLMPRFGSGSGRGLLETAICYKKLLETIKTKEVSEEDKLSVTIVVASMDFLSFAYEPYDEQVKPPSDLEHELSAIVKKLVSDKFAIIMEKLAPVYRRQYRHTLFYNILQHPPGPTRDLDESFATNILEFTRHHLVMFSTGGLDFDSTAYYTARQIHKDAKGATVRDIFGWTPYHYSCLSVDGHLTRQMIFTMSPEAVERLPKLLDNFGRSPIHIAAFAGSYSSLEQILLFLGSESLKSVIHAGGVDKMTPLHLISRNGSLACLELMTRYGVKPPLAEKDFWGRQALHIASRFGHQKIAAKLLEIGSRSDDLDDAGKCPVDYFVERQKDSDGESAVQGQQSNELESNGVPSNDSGREAKLLSKASCDLFLKFAMEPGCRYSNGKSFLHIAVEVADDESIHKLLRDKFDVEAQDKDGRTPLHHAILCGRASVAKTLLDEFHANPLAKDSHSTTALMFAAHKSLIEVARALLPDSNPSPVDEVDDEKRAAIHFARNREMADFLVTKKCNLLATDSIGRTALHTAIDRKDKDVALYLLGLEGSGQVQLEPFDDGKDSLLVTACKRGFHEIVPEILKRWPGIINIGDSQFGQPPISWACENGYSDVVENLLQYKGIERVDVNKAATKWNKLTPLHFAAKAKDSKSLNLLLRQPATKLDSVSDTGETPLARAVEYNRIDSARMLLEDNRMPPGKRLYYVKEFTSSLSSIFHSLVGDVLEALTNTSLIHEYFLWLYSITPTSEVQESIDKFVSNMKQGGWEKLQIPYHVAILIGDVEFIQALKRQNVSQGDVDEDNWSVADYVKRFDHKGTLAKLLGDLQLLEATRKVGYKEPTALIWSSYEKNVQVVSCTTEGHDLCSKVYTIEVIQDSMDPSRACMRSEHSIPPSKKYFYFEVEVLQDSNWRILGLGFCGLGNSYNQMPGWFKGSWGYHGDDGKFFIESGSGSIPSSDFGDSGTYKSGDIVGVCLSMNTGQGFCTRNGKRLNMGNAFKSADERFKFGKIYPCVGFDVDEGVGLRFRVNFDGSDNHPFKYKGSFEF